MTTKTNEKPTFEELTEQIASLKAERAEEAKALRADGIEADKEIRDGLAEAVNEAVKVVQGLSVALTTAERRKASLDQRVDAGDDTVTPLEVVEADMAVRSTKGKQKPADLALRKAKRAVEPFHADDHLALLACDVLEPLVEVPVLIRKRAGDVGGISNAIVLSQTEPTEKYGTVYPSGQVNFTEIGETNLDMEALRLALRNTGSEVQVHHGLIDFERALFALPRLREPSAGEVVHFADALARKFQEIVHHPTRDRTYAMYNTIWQTTQATLDIIEPGKARGTLKANFAVDRERPPLEQAVQFMKEALEHFETGVHTVAGQRDEINVVNVLDAGPWLSSEEGYIPERRYSQRFILELAIDYSYEVV
jgi:hypothetical protein